MNYTKIVNVTLKNTDKELKKSPAVKKWLKAIDAKINKFLIEQNFGDKLVESMILGLPLIFDGKNITMQGDKMSHRRAKKIRKMLREANKPINAEPYRMIGRTIIASDGRRGYQKVKEMK
jgi:hypothetical protein